MNNILSHWRVDRRSTHSFIIITASCNRTYWGGQWRELTRIIYTNGYNTSSAEELHVHIVKKRYIFKN
jgi:uncharacterized protein with PIN domain